MTLPSGLHTGQARRFMKTYQNQSEPHAWFIELLIEMKICVHSSLHSGITTIRWQLTNF
jgi:hypothetical protein